MNVSVVKIRYKCRSIYDDMVTILHNFIIDIASFAEDGSPNPMMFSGSKDE